MLAIKTVMSEDADKTLIFDEIDAGISGKTASKVSNQLARLSLSHQIICITHLPQIAAMADAHYIIEKSVHDNKTYSNIQRVMNMPRRIWSVSLPRNGLLCFLLR